MNQDKLIESLENYRSYKFAIKNGVAPYDPYDRTGMPFASEYGSRAPRLSGGSTLQSELDLQRYTRIVHAIDGAVAEVLDDDQATVIKRKYLDRNKRTLDQIARERGCDPSSVSRWHRKALKQLAIALEFVDAPEIINLDHMKISA